MYARNRYAAAPHCPCGKSNKDGKFSPRADDPTQGYCFSCGRFFGGALFPDGAPPKESPSAQQKGSVPSHCPCGKPNGPTGAERCVYESGGRALYCFKCDWSVSVEKLAQREAASAPANPPRGDAPCRIDGAYVSRTLGKPSHFLTWLIGLFGQAAAQALAVKYFLGASKAWPGANVFWLIDKDGEVRSGKVMLCDPRTGKREKDKNQWAHKLLPEYRDNFRLEQCFFGERLLASAPDLPVAVVEAPKTAMVCAQLFPDRVWLATGGKFALRKPEQLSALAGRRVILYPDADAYAEWQTWARELLRAGARAVTIDTTLEHSLTPEQKAAGWDLVDYLQWIGALSAGKGSE